MKKLLLMFTILISFANMGLAEAANTYKVYNPKENKSYVTTLGTVTVVNDLFLFALYKDNKPYCVLDGNQMNKKDNLIGGQCTEYNAFMYSIYHNNQINMDKYIFWFREINENTFYKEARAMRANRIQKGLKFYGDNFNQLKEVQ